MYGQQDTVRRAVHEVWYRASASGILEPMRRHREARSDNDLRTIAAESAAIGSRGLVLAIAHDREAGSPEGRRSGAGGCLMGGGRLTIPDGLRNDPVSLPIH